MTKKRKIRKGRVSLALLSIFILGFLIVGGILLWPKEDTKKEIAPPSNQVDSQPEEEPVEPEVPQPKKMSIVMVGDALLHNVVYNDAKQSDGTYDFHSMMSYLGPIIQDYDLKYYNQETIIGGGTPSTYPRFNSPDAIGKDMVDIGFNLVSLANNHSLDQGEKGILYSNEFWKNQNGVVTAGTYSSLEERNEIPIYVQNDISYAFLSYTEKTNGLQVPTGKDYLLNVYDKEKVKEDITKAKEKGAEVIIVAMHWGSEYTHIPTSSEKEIAQYLSELGVNLIIGCHPHVVQPMEYVGDTLVIYSLGNLVSAQHPLGLDKIIGLLVGLDIVVEPDSTVHFENIQKQLLYTYCTSNYKNFKIYPFKDLTNDILKNYKEIEKEYLEIVGEVE